MQCSPLAQRCFNGSLPWRTSNSASSLNLDNHPIRLIAQCSKHETKPTGLNILSWSRSCTVNDTIRHSSLLLTNSTALHYSMTFASWVLCETRTKLLVLSQQSGTTFSDVYIKCHQVSVSYEHISVSKRSLRLLDQFNGKLTCFAI